LLTRLQVHYNQEDLPTVPLHWVMISPLKVYQQVTLNASNTSLTELNS
jgi:hypothetical protein